MIKKINQAIFICFFITFLLLPLIVIPVTSELFEFNKMVFIYLMTSIITSLWLAKILVSKKINFQKTPLDLPILIFLAANIISAIFSIDKNLSIFGYYSRFNGGLLSLFSYSILYWAFVNNISKEKVSKIVKAIVLSSVLVCLYAILQKAGIDKNIWVQDVQNRVFSSLGQPNWLAAFIVLIFFLPFSAFKEKKSSKLIFIFTIAYFLVILFTKSRSGILGLVFSWLVFWLPLLRFKERENKIYNPKNFFYLTVMIIFITFLVGTPWTPSFGDIVLKNKEAPITTNTTSLETGGTESGEIRKIVWKGALKIWQNYPLFGSGPETFALSYFKFKPQEHNLTSEWNFIYNKAHNEYLNYLANTGILGFLSYLLLISSSLIFLYKNSFSTKTRKNKERIIKLEHISLLAGKIGFLITNIFGFSVVVTNFLFFIYPAISFCLNQEEEEKRKEKNDYDYNFTLIIPLILLILAVYTIINYWRADFYYNQGKNQNINKNYTAARYYLTKAINLNPYEPTFLDELAKSTFGLAISSYNKGDVKTTQQLINQSLNEMNETIKMSPNNVIFKKDLSAILFQISIIDPNFKDKTIESLIEITQLAPTDPKVYYNLGLMYFRSDQLDKAKENFEKSISLKVNYREPHLALATLYSKTNQTDKAKEELNYILQKIDPNDQTAKRQLQELE